MRGQYLSGRYSKGEFNEPNLFLQFMFAYLLIIGKDYLKKMLKFIKVWKRY